LAIPSSVRAAPARGTVVTDHAPTHREARLRTEHAHHYPGCPAGEWLPASTAAAYVLGHREVLLDPVRSRAERALNPEEWEFRGENRFATSDRSQRRRFTDRHASGAYAVVTQVPGQSDGDLFVDSESTDRSD
jgi:hypothetical protein